MNSSFLVKLYTQNITNVTFLGSNATNLHAVAKWTVLPTFSLVTLILGLITNSVLLCTFIKDRILRTPFNVYLINLMLANLSILIAQSPMSVIYYLYSYKWTLGDKACTFYLYGYDVIQAILLNSHLLIALNRIWAAVHPISYRTRHSMRTAVLLCVGLWVLIHLIVVPWWATDALYYRLPVEATHTCIINSPKQPSFSHFIQLCIFDPPTVIMILSFPIICLAKMKRRNFRHRRTNPILPSSVSVSQQNSGISDVSGQQIPKVRVVEDHQMIGYNGGLAPRVIIIPLAKKLKKQKPNSHGTLVLALLTINVMICWGPGLVYFTMRQIIHVDIPTMTQTAIIMASCQTMLDPILFTLALPNLRASLRSLFKL